MGDLQIAFRLPVSNWPRAVFDTNYGYDGGELKIDGQTVVVINTRQELEQGVQCTYAGRRALKLHLRLQAVQGTQKLQLHLDGQPAPEESALSATPSRSAWAHAFIALAASAAGFAASWLYLLKADTLDSAWALKMGNHMAGWHLLLTFCLFPASVWGQRVGIRSVQFVSFVFFCIHAGIALVNLGAGSAMGADDFWIGVLNALSGVTFFWATLYGQRAWRDMDPVRALQAGRAHG